MVFLILALLADNAWGYDLFDGRWEGVYWPSRAIVQVDIWPELCADGQAEALEAHARRTLDVLATLDPGRQWEFIGERPGSGWGVWGDGIVTIECAYPSQMFGNSMGQAVPIQAEGEMVDGGIMISNGIEPWRWKKVLAHEIGHALLALDHSQVNGATMQTAVFGTELSYQLAEIYNRDDLCGIWAKYQSVGEFLDWPFERPLIDDKQNLYIPGADWEGQEWEFWMLNNGQGQFGVVLAKPLAPC